MTLLEKIISSQNLENAFNILCKQRKDYISYADIWDLHYNWSSYKQQIIPQFKQVSLPLIQQTNISSKMRYVINIQRAMRWI
jgi:hypothetical protein